jgi:peptide/nickel transport system substrate-binding protein
MHSARSWLVMLTSLTMVMTLVAVAPGLAQDKPRPGGELIFVVPAEPPGFDGHREETFAMLHPIAPHYNTLLRTDPTDKTGTKFIGDLAESWTVSGDKRTYTFKIRQGVKFTTGSDDGARRQGVVRQDHLPARRRRLEPASAVQGRGVRGSAERHHRRVPAEVSEGSFIASVASPWNWIYRAEILAKDPHWYEKNVMGTGPVQVRGVRARLALDQQEEPGLLGQGQAVPRQLPRALHP